MGVNFKAAELLHAKLRGALFDGANFLAANVSFSDLQGTSLVAADFEKAKLEAADLRGAVFFKPESTPEGWKYNEAKFSGAVLKNANFCGADLTKVSTLTQSQLKSAISNQATKTPIAPQ
jgi:uncharacterized protein YjbI with pentapeptide repeats